jgi:hypothetical protein
MLSTIYVSLNQEWKIMQKNARRRRRGVGRWGVDVIFIKIIIFLKVEQKSAILTQNTEHFM